MCDFFMLWFGLQFDPLRINEWELVGGVQFAYALIVSAISLFTSSLLLSILTVDLMCVYIISFAI